MAGVWARGGFVRVERRAPIATVAGKVLHLQAGRPGPAASSTGDLRERAGSRANVGLLE
jgi:hypothetical protein